MIVSVYAVVQFFETTDMREMLLWGAVAFFGFMSVLAVKIWTWMEMAKNEIMREVKRTELQIAYLANKLDKPVE